MSSFSLPQPHKDDIPPRAVREAFGLGGTIPSEPLPGGEGHSHRIGDVVLKPAHEIIEAEWCSGVMAHLSTFTHPSFRIPAPLQPSNSKCVFQGWTASEWVAGTTNPMGHWEGILEASRAFHEALRPLQRLDFLGHQAQPWTLADQVAWGEVSVDIDAAFRKVFHELLDLRQDIEVDCQVIHGDLTGNVLFEDGLPPAVIDFSPYWRPVEFADAIIVADGLLDFAEAQDLIHLCGASSKHVQMLVRALIFRLVSESELKSFRGITREEVDRFERALGITSGFVSPVPDRSAMIGANILVIFELNGKYNNYNIQSEKAGLPSGVTLDGHCPLPERHTLDGTRERKEKIKQVRKTKKGTQRP